MDSGAQQTVPGFTLISRRVFIKMPVKTVAQLQRQFSLSNGHSQLKVMIKFLKKKKVLYFEVQSASKVLGMHTPPENNNLDK